MTISGNTGDNSRNIFRPDALQRYRQGRQRVVLPQYAAQSATTLLWTLIAVLAVGAALVSFARVPVITEGTAVVDASGRRAVVFLPPASLPQLRAGQPVALHFGTSVSSLSTSIEHVEPAVLSPFEARRRFGLDVVAASTVARPSSVVTVRIGAERAQGYAGSIVAASVRTGDETFASRLSVVGRRGGA